LNNKLDKISIFVIKLPTKKGKNQHDDLNMNILFGNIENISSLEKKVFEIFFSLDANFILTRAFIF